MRTGAQNCARLRYATRAREETIMDTAHKQLESWQKTYSAIPEAVAEIVRLHDATLTIMYLEKSRQYTIPEKREPGKSEIALRLREFKHKKAEAKRQALIARNGQQKAFTGKNVVAILLARQILGRLTPVQKQLIKMIPQVAAKTEGNRLAQAIDCTLSEQFIAGQYDAIGTLHACIRVHVHDLTNKEWQSVGYCGIQGEWEVGKVEETPKINPKAVWETDKDDKPKEGRQIAIPILYAVNEAEKVLKGL
jgi:hypothetical protein